MSTIVDDDSGMNKLLAYVKKLAKSVHKKKYENDITVHNNGFIQVKEKAKVSKGGSVWILPYYLDSYSEYN